jgi:hypothetical protein
MVSTMKKLLDESCARPSFREDVEKTMLGKVNQTIALVTTSQNSYFFVTDAAEKLSKCLSRARFSD